MQIPSQELMTKENVTIHVDAVAFYKVEDPLKALCKIEGSRCRCRRSRSGMCISGPFPRSCLEIRETDLGNCGRPRCATSYLDSLLTQPKSCKEALTQSQGRRRGSSQIKEHPRGQFDDPHHGPRRRSGASAQSTPHRSLCRTRSLTPARPRWARFRSRASQPQVARDAKPRAYSGGEQHGGDDSTGELG